MRNGISSQRSETHRDLLASLYHTLLTGYPDSAIFLFDEDLRYLHVGGDEFKRSRYTVSDLIGKSIHEVLEASIVAQVEPYYRAALRGEANSFEYTSQRLEMVYHVRAFPVYSDAGKIIAGAVIATDITQQKQTAALIQQKDLRYRAIVEDQTELICRYTPDGVLTFVNGALCRTFDTTVDQLLGTSFASLFDPHGQRQLVRSLAMVSFADPFVTNERMLQLPNGRLCWMRWTDRAIYSPDGEVIEYQSVGFDITERVMATRSEHEQRALADALVDIAGVLNSTLDLSQVFKRILDNIGRVVPHNTANLMLIDDDVARVMRGRGYPHHLKDVVQGLELSVSKTPHLAAMVRTGQPITVSDVEADSAIWDAVPELNVVKSYLGAPISLHGQVIGFLNLESRTPAFFTAAPDKWLRAFTDSAAIAIRNAQLYERAQDAAVWEERQAIARELHDAVSQTLFSANMIADALPYMWEQHADNVPNRLQELRQLTYHAMAELRTMLLELRPQTLIDTNFSDLLEQLVQAYGRRTSTEMRLDTDERQPVDLPIDVKVTLYRIAQEAVNNIVQHAEASDAQICVEAFDQGVALRISDNGRGFEIDRSYPGHHGLCIMRERAEKIGAELEISSVLQVGTTIQVNWIN